MCADECRRNVAEAQNAMYVVAIVAWVGAQGFAPAVRSPVHTRPHIWPVKTSQIVLQEPETAAEPAQLTGWDWAGPRVALLLMAGSCGLNFPAISYVEEFMPPSEATSLRFACALLPFLPLIGQRLPNLFSDRTVLPGLEIGAWCAFGYVTQAIGLAQTSPAKGAFICALFMVFTPLINGLSGRRVSLQAWLAVAIALLGTACLEGLVPGVGSSSGLGQLAGGLEPGDVWCLGTALGFGAMFARMEAHMEALDDPDAALPLTAWQCVAIASITAAWHAAGGGGLAELFSGLQATTEAAPLVMPAIAFMGLISGAGVLWGETECAKSVPSSEMGVIFATEPVWAAVFASVLLHDEITTNELVGGACIVIACLCLQLPEEQLSAALFGPTTTTSSQSQ